MPQNEYIEAYTVEPCYNEDIGTIEMTFVVIAGLRTKHSKGLIGPANRGLS